MMSTSRAKMYEAPPPLSLSIVRVKGHTLNYCAEGGRSLGTRLLSLTAGNGETKNSGKHTVH